MELTNEQNAKRLEELARWAEKNALRWKYIAEDCASHPAESEGSLALSEAESADAALLRASAALWRERDGVRWEEWGTGSATVYKRRFVYIEQWKGVKDRRFRWDVNEAGSEYLGDAFGYAPTLDAAKAAAIAWVDAQEGKNA